MATYGPHILALTVLALGTSQIVAQFLTLPMVYLPYADPIEKCRSIKLGNPNPVCASDGYTYYNTENLNCLNMFLGYQIRFKSFGECNITETMLKPPGFITSGCPCLNSIGYDTKIDQFCGSDGFTYYSQSEANCISSCYGYPIVRVHDGPCTVADACNCPRFDLSEPICGSDGQTYDNRQALACSNYCKKQRVIERFTGKCGGASVYSAGK